MYPPAQIFGIDIMYFDAIAPPDVLRFCVFGVYCQTEQLKIIGQIILKRFISYDISF